MELLPLACEKIVSHALKYPHCAVSGLMLGRYDEKQHLSVVDVLPLLHSGHTLSPMMEIALLSADALASTRELQLVGLYYLPDRLGVRGNTVDAAPPPYVRVLEKVNCHVAPKGTAVLLVVDNESLLSCEAGGWKGWQFAQPPPLRSISVAMAVDRQKVDLLQLSGKHHLLIDFDDHLRDSALDWTNPQWKV